MASANDFNIMGFSGSLRSGSLSTRVLHTLPSVSAEKARITIFNIAGIPLYNQDTEDAGLPDSVQKFKDSIAAADGLVIVTPEYNYGISGVLKNAIDWASRPGYQSVLKDKPVLMIATSPAFTGGVRAIHQLRETLAATLSRVVAVPEIVISQVDKKIENGSLTDGTSLKYISGGMDALVAEISMLRNSG